MTYLEIASSTSATKPIRRVSGQYLARARLNREQRAELAAALVDGTAEVFPPTVKQAATLAAVPVVAVTRVRRNGKPKRSPSKTTETLAEHIPRSSPAERIAAARAVGVDAVWSTMIVPALTAEQDNA